jgi:hypothetical protein
VAGTPVLMADGSSKAIEEVKKGDKVLSKDEASGKIVAKEVVSTKVRTAPSTLVIEVAGGMRVETTPEHPFYVEGTGWTPAGQLAIGNAIVTRAGPSLKIVRIETKETPAAVYNFEVADTHSYFVGDTKSVEAGGETRCEGRWLWVHNYPNPDPPMSHPPVRFQPETVEQVQRMRMGKGPTTKATHGTNNIEAHHRQQVPTRDGGVLDEITEFDHRRGGNHTRHQLPSRLTPAERAEEIREHWKTRGMEYILPGEGI